MGFRSRIPGTNVAQCLFFFLSNDIFPLNTILAVSHNTVGEISGESFISMKAVHSFTKKEINSESLSREVLNLHLLMGCLGCLVFKLNDTGAWSLITIVCILVSEISAVIDLLIKKKSIQEND